MTSIADVTFISADARQHTVTVTVTVGALEQQSCRNRDKDE